MASLVLDTNILVSAIWSSNGNPARVVELVLYGEVGVYLNPDICKEYKDVLNRPKFNFKQEHVQNILNGLFECGNLVNVEPSKIVLPDESDRKFYDVAKATGSLLISGNLKHFPNEPLIMSPAEYLNKFKTP
ncbi:MAG: putative toxin-antitoxin system toxin component, PIN family [Candidatus Fibromonas sp.]|jgi:putative PIN family toxin of toxin-antitoxin system|nr:putative toxin-antitoxin system toxin component, PIN family [Candidatus Fibromonas sp.]